MKGQDAARAEHQVSAGSVGMKALGNPPAARAVIHDPDCGVPTGRTWACACNERNGYRVTSPGKPAAAPDGEPT